MTRIATFATGNHLLSHLMQTQSRVDERQTQIATEKVAQTYAGVPRDTTRLLSIESASQLTARFQENNAVMKTRLKVTDSAVTSAETVMRDFRATLATVGAGEPLDRARVDEIQAAAFRALKEIETLLNSKADGAYLFAGSRVTTEPVEFGLTTLADFQATYDGRTTLFAANRDANLADFQMAPAGNWLTFVADPAGPSKIRVGAAQAADVQNIVAGTPISIGGTPGGAHNGRFVVQAVGSDATGTYLEVVEERFFTAVAANATIRLADGTELAASATGALTFNGGTDTVTAATPGAFTGPLAAGTVFEISGSGANDGVYEVASNDGTTLTIASRKLGSSGGAAVAGSISAASYYQGDELVQTHRTDEERALTLDVTAADPGFEKAIRAIALIAQGAAGTSGGLEHHLDRIDDAIALINGALDPTVAAGMVASGELEATLEGVKSRVAFNLVVVDETETRQRDLIASLEIEIAKIENVDLTEAMARMLDDANALEASFQALARIRRLSLSQFL
jgi:flagellin-like hook-associated protein FlgL